MKRCGVMGACLFLVLAGCASIVEGTDQTVYVHLNPQDAACDVHREGLPIARVSGDNPYLHLSKSKNDLTLTCKADGYQEQVLMIESSASGWGVAGCFLIDLCITDYSTGALNKYPESITISLQPEV